MKKVYTQTDGTYVFPDPEALKVLKPDSCTVRKVDEKICLIPLEDLKGKQVEDGDRHGYSPVWRYQNDKNEPYILMNGQKADTKYCNFCKDRLNGITGNCFNQTIKPNGCSFNPVDDLKPFEISMDGWKKLRAIDLNKDTPFYKPRPCSVDFNPKTIKRNKKIRLIARHLPEYQEKKVEKYCSRCIYQGTCNLNSSKVAEHCMVTEDEIIKQCLNLIRRRYGSVDEYLNLLAYSGGKFIYKPPSHVRESEWRVSQPFSKKQFEIMTPFNCYSELKVQRKFVEDLVTPIAVPEKNREKIAALAWDYLDRYHFHRLWISLKAEGIKATHHTRGANRSFRAEIFTSFNEIHYFFNR